MKISVIAFVSTIILGIVGMLVDQSIGLDGNFSLIVSIAAIGSFIVYGLNSSNK